MTISKDFVSALIEEVALEGLDGITLQALWLRLEDRKDFPFIPITAKVRQILWNILVKLSCLDFYLTSKPRKKLKIFDKVSCTDSSGNYIVPAGYEDIYPHCSVHIEASGIMGSCADYFDRTIVTGEVLTYSVEEVYMKWGLRLLIVANQETRKAALCGPSMNPFLEFTVNEYCMLERIGRSRHHGEITQGPYGLKLISDDNKMLFYFRKCLFQRDLITAQNFYIKLKNVNTSGKILHLKRFSVLVKSKMQTDAENLIKYLKSTPKMIAPYKDLFKLNLKSDVKKLLKKLMNNVKSEIVLYREAYPDAPPSQWKCKGNNVEKNTRIIRLISEETVGEEEEEEDEEECSGILDESRRMIGVPLLRQGYLALEKSHISGMTQTSLGRFLGMNTLQARSLCKQLKRYKLCGTTLCDTGRQRALNYYCKKFECLKSSLPAFIASEKSKLLQIINNENSVEDIPEAVIERTMCWNEFEPETSKNNHGSQLSSVQTQKITLKKPNDEDINAIKTEIVVLKSPKSFEKTQSFLDLTGADDSGNVSLRILKRVNLILQAVSNLKIIHDPQKLIRMINEEEELEGFNYTVDRKSVLRILEKLEHQGHIQRIKVTLTSANREKTITFICHPSITPQHSVIQSAIEQAKMKLPIITKETVGKCTNNPSNDSPLKFTYDHRIGRLQYGFKPKFIRLRCMHFYLYYLVYNYTGNEKMSHFDKNNLLINNNLGSGLLDEMCQIYHDKLDWKLFIPPLPEHKDYPKGWCLVSDILVRLPLFMFLSLVNIPYKIAGIMEYLEHPLKKFYLVKDLPPDISNHLTIMRKYIYTLCDMLYQLAYIGLVQFGPQKMKEKDQVFIYVNKNAILCDTTISEEGYNHISKNLKYQEKKYKFSSLADLESYWSDLMKFAMNTKLGNRACAAGQEVVVESISTKKQMLEAVRAKTTEEAFANDVGFLPGDHLGAAGIDSDLFVHLKRNWFWSSGNKNNVCKEKVAAPEKQTVEKNVSSRSKAVKSVALDKSSPDKNIDIRNKVDDVKSGSSASKCKGFVKVQKTPIAERKSVHKKVTRVVVPRVTIRKPYYDQKDKEALNRMNKLRVDWLAPEDNVLLLCKVASLFMCPYSMRKKVRNFSFIREILHKNLPDFSLNKTSRACQRRIIYMMKNPQSAHSVDVCLEELAQDQELVAQYGHATMNRLLTKFKDEGKPGERFMKKYDEMFMELVEKLMDKVKSVSFNKSILENDLIPNELYQFYSKYDVAVPCSSKRVGLEKYSEVKNCTNIMSNTLSTVIHSSLACAADKTCYSYQMLHIYQQYPDNLLRSVMGNCRNLGIVSMKKHKKLIKNNSDHCLPVTMSPFKLSITYINRLQTKYQHRIFSNSYYLLSNITHKINDNTSEMEVEINVQNGGECALIVALQSLGLLKLNVEFPEQVIVLDPKLSETEETFSKILKRFNDLISHIKARNQNKKTNQGYETDNEDYDSKYDCNYEEFNDSNKNGLASAASRLALFSLKDDSADTTGANIQHTHDYFVINPCKVSLSFQQNSLTALRTLYSNFTQKEETLNNLRRLSILPAKLPTEDDLLNLNLSSLDLLNYIKGKEELGAKGSEILETFGTSVIKDVEKLVDQQLILRTGVVSIRFVHFKFLKPWVIRSYNLPRLVKETLATGPQRVQDIKEMQVVIKETELDETTSNDFSEKRKVNETDELQSEESTSEGCLEPPSKKLRTYSNMPCEKVVKFNKVVESKCLKELEVAIRPWIRIDGTMNRRVLDHMLSSVLGQVCYSPGVSVQKLQTRFSPSLQPAFTHELVLILSKLGCVNLMKLKEKSIPSLFSSRSTVFFTEATGLEDSTHICVEPDPMAIVKLGLFIGNKTYAGSYLDQFVTSTKS